MAISKNTRRAHLRTNPTVESILHSSNVSSERRQSWKAAQRRVGDQTALRFPVYKQLYLLNLYAGKISALLNEIGIHFNSKDESAYYQTLVQEVRSEITQSILETMNGVEITDSFLNDQLRKQV